MQILITGGNGYIAKALSRYLHDRYSVTSITRNDFDLTNYDATAVWFEKRRYDIVIHTAITGGTRLKSEDDSIYHNNISMFHNLFKQKQHFTKLLSFGSGAEIFHGDTPYANSKRDIAQMIMSDDQFYNLRIFGVFDENELNTRFIKSNILRHINKQPMIVYNDKIMDFYYMKDLLTLVEYYIQNKNLPKEINCSYENKFTLSQIAKIINSIGTYEVPIIVENNKNLEFYCGSSHKLNINEIGFDLGIKETYKKIKNSI